MSRKLLTKYPDTFFKNNSHILGQSNIHRQLDLQIVLQGVQPQFFKNGLTISSSDALLKTGCLKDMFKFAKYSKSLIGVHIRVQ